MYAIGQKDTRNKNLINKNSWNFEDLKVQVKAQSLGKDKESKFPNPTVLVVKNAEVRVPSEGMPS